MTDAESPGAVAALGASEQIDQLGGKVDPENSPRGLIAQPLRLRAGVPFTQKPRGHNRRRVRARRRWRQSMAIRKGESPWEINL